MDSCARAGELTRAPILLLHGVDDSVIELRHATLLERAAAGVEVRVVRVEGAGHTDLPRGLGRAHDAEIASFLALE